MDRRQRTSSWERHVGPVLRWQDDSRGLSARGGEGRPNRTIADIEILAVRACTAASGLEQRGLLVANRSDRVICGRCTRTGSIRGRGGCGEEERSAERDRDFVRHLLGSLRLCVGVVQVFERIVRMVTRGRRFGCTPFRANARMHHGYRVHRASVFPIRRHGAH